MHVEERATQDSYMNTSLTRLPLLSLLLLATVHKNSTTSWLMHIISPENVVKVSHELVWIE